MKLEPLEIRLLFQNLPPNCQLTNFHHHPAVRILLGIHPQEKKSNEQHQKRPGPKPERFLGQHQGDMGSGRWQHDAEIGGAARAAAEEESPKGRHPAGREAAADRRATAEGGLGLGGSHWVLLSYGGVVILTPGRVESQPCGGVDLRMVRQLWGEAYQANIKTWADPVNSLCWFDQFNCNPQMGTKPQ